MSLCARASSSLRRASPASLELSLARASASSCLSLTRLSDSSCDSAKLSSTQTSLTGLPSLSRTRIVGRKPLLRTMSPSGISPRVSSCSFATNRVKTKSSCRAVAVTNAALLTERENLPSLSPTASALCPIYARKVAVNRIGSGSLQWARTLTFGTGSPDSCTKRPVIWTALFIFVSPRRDSRPSCRVSGSKFL
jgi:hypothetical protein